MIITSNRLSIYTGRNTYLLGSAVYSEVDNLKLDTGSLIFDNYQDSDVSVNVSVYASLAFSDKTFVKEQSDASGSLTYRVFK